MGVAYWVEQMAADVDMEMRERKEEALLNELDKFVNGFNLKSSSQRANTWI